MLIQCGVNATYTYIYKSVVHGVWYPHETGKANKSVSG